jgi:hypothetical protein
MALLAPEAGRSYAESVNVSFQLGDSCGGGGGLILVPGSHKSSYLLPASLDGTGPSAPMQTSETLVQDLARYPPTISSIWDVPTDGASRFPPGPGSGSEWRAQATMASRRAMDVCRSASCTLRPRPATSSFSVASAPATVRRRSGARYRLAMGDFPGVRNVN